MKIAFAAKLDDNMCKQHGCCWKTTSIVSEEFLSADQWPININYLVRNGWSAPDEEVPNWHKQGVPPLEAGHQILEGLAHGRNCHDLQKVRWHSGDFPGGPGPDGGVILDYESGGAVRNLRRAS